MRERKIEELVYCLKNLPVEKQVEFMTQIVLELCQSGKDVVVERDKARKQRDELLEKGNKVLKWHRPEGILNDDAKERWENFEDVLVSAENEQINERIEERKKEKERKKAEKGK